MYALIHQFCVYMQLDILNTQADAIIKGKSAFKITKSSYKSDELSLAYWPDREGRSSTLKVWFIPDQFAYFSPSSLFQISNRHGRSELRVEHIPTLTDPATGEAAVLKVVPTKVNLEQVLMAARGLHMHNRLLSLKQKCNSSQWSSIEMASSADMASNALKIHLFDHYYVTIRVDPCSGQFLLGDIDQIVETSLLAKLLEQLNQNPDGVNAVIYTVSIRVLQHAIRQAARDAGLVAPEIGAPLSSSEFVPPTIDDLVALDSSLSLPSATRASLAAPSFTMFLKYDDPALRQYVVVMKVDISGAGGPMKPKVSHWLLRLRRVPTAAGATSSSANAATAVSSSGDSSVVKTPRQLSFGTLPPTTPKTPGTPGLPSSHHASAWKIVIEWSSGSVAELVDVASHAPLSADKTKQAAVDPTGDSSEEPALKKRKRVGDEFVLNPSKKTKIAEPATPSTPGSTFGAPEMSPGSLLFVSLASLADACRAKISQANLLDQLTAHGVPFQLSPFSQDAYTANVIEKYRLQMQISPMLINEVFLTMYAPLLFHTSLPSLNLLVETPLPHHSPGASLCSKPKTSLPLARPSIASKRPTATLSTLQRSESGHLPTLKSPRTAS